MGTATGRYIAAALVISTAASALWAHGGATGVVKQRMDAMVGIAKAMKVLAPMMGGKTNYDPAEVRSAARNIAQHSGDRLVIMFPEGSDGAPSEAKPEIWADPDRFSALATRLAALAQGLDAAAGNKLSGGPVSPATLSGDEPLPDPEGFSQMPPDKVFAMMGHTCLACHSAYRIKTD